MCVCLNRPYRAYRQGRTRVGLTNQISIKQVPVCVCVSLQVVQTGAKALKKTKEVISSRAVLIIGIAILILAVLLRLVFGW